MVVGVSHNDVVLCVHGHLARLRVLTLHDPKLAKHAMIDHLFIWLLAAVADWLLGCARRHLGEVDRRLGDNGEIFQVGLVQTFIA